MDGVGTTFTTSPRMMWVRGKLGNRREIPFSGHFLPVYVPLPAPLHSTLQKKPCIERVFFFTYNQRLRIRGSLMSFCNNLFQRLDPAVGPTWT